MTHFKFALRQLLKHPGFTAVAVLTLALGIGTCTAMFSIVHAVLLKPLPVREPENLVWIENVFDAGLSGRTSRADTLLGWREQSQSFESLAAYFAFSDYGQLTLTGKGEPERLRGVGVSDNFLSTLGVSPVVGRNFTAEECRWLGNEGLSMKPGAVLLSYGFWKRRFGGDANIVGQSLTLNNVPTTVVGILPESFNFSSLFTPASPVDVLTPFPLAPETARWGNTVFGIGRLKPGVSITQAQAELSSICLQLRKVIDAGPFGAKVQTLDSALRGKFRTAFLVLTAAVGCVLAIACVNLSNLLLARLNARRQEFAVRTFLGASRWNLIQQTLSESLLLAVLGSLLGTPLAALSTQMLARLQSFGVPMLQDATVDYTALLVTISLTTAAGILCGILPALHLSTTTNTQGSQDATHQRTSGRSTASARSILVVAEVALACILLVGAGLLIQSFGSILQVNLGFQPQQAMSWRIDPTRAFSKGEEVDAYLRALKDKVAEVAGVQSVGFTDTLPLGRNRSWGVGVVGVQYPPGQFPSAYPRLVDPDYLKTMQIPLVAGQHFAQAFNPTADRAAIINENFARRLFPNQDPLGQKLTIGRGATVIGVVANVRHSSLENDQGNEVYLDCRRNRDWSTLEMVVRSSRTPESLVPDIRTAMASFDASLPSGEYQPLLRLVEDAVGPRELITRLLGFFSALALTLAAVGLYGVIAYSVTQRTQEIGVRMAIGARRIDVLNLILAGGLKLVGIGIVLGLVGALVFTRLLDGLLFGVSAYDPWIFLSYAALLLLVAGIACFLPAYRATRLEPIVALRHE